MASDFTAQNRDPTLMVTALTALYRGLALNALDRSLPLNALDRGPALKATALTAISRGSAMKGTAPARDYECCTCIHNYNSIPARNQKRWMLTEPVVHVQVHAIASDSPFFPHPLLRRPPPSPPAVPPTLPCPPLP